VVVNDERVVLGRVRLDDLGQDTDTTVEQVMLEGPTTFRANVRAHEMLEYMMRRGRMRDTLVTDPEGRLIGVIRREDLEETVHRMHARAAAEEDEEER
jgi:Mg/Co/Ni transporter MgtE